MNETKTTKSSDVKFVELSLCIAFVVISIVSNVIAGKVIKLPFGLTVAGASLLVPFYCILDDLNTNCLGYGSAKRWTWLSSAANIFMSCMFALICIWPSPEYIDSNAYSTVLGQSIRVVVASQLAFLVSSFLNSYIVSKMKASYVDKGGDTKDKWHIFFRTFGSSIPTVLVDAFIFNLIAFTGNMPMSTVLAMALTQWGVKLLVELVMQPVLVNIIPWFIKKTGKDVIDREGFNPFKVD